MNSATIKIWLLPILLQFAFYYQICGFWDPDSHYFFGWGIPVLSLFLFWCRTEDEPPRGESNLGWLLPACCFLLLFFGLRVLWETMSSWHMLSWTQGLCLAAFGLIWAGAWGGFRWAKHFAFPMLFFLASIPWPGRIELALSDWLTGHIANFVTFSLQMLGIPAMLTGIQISIGDSVVEVAEACSGIRSLQFLLMTTLFLGEYGKLSLPRRSLLIVAGLCASFVQNAVRALALGWITGIEGQAAYDKWHDNTGAITFVLGLALVFIAFLIIEPKHKAGSAKVSQSPPPQLPRPLIGLTAFLLLLYGGTELFRSQWYALPDDDLARQWTLVPEKIEDFPAHRTLEVDQLVKDIFETEDIHSGQFWLGDSRVDYHFISWKDGYSVMRANAHTPDVCMGSVKGLIMAQGRQLQYFDKPWDEIEYESYVFQDPISAQRIAVFRSMLLPVSTKNYNQFYEQASGGWGQKWSLAWQNFWDRVDENSMITRQLLIIGVTSPGDQVERDTLQRFINEALSLEQS